MKNNELRNFGLIWAGIFLVIGMLPLIKGNNLRIWSILLSLLFIIIVSIKPQLLSSFYAIWTKIGEFLGGIISKVMLSILFFLFFTPIAYILRFIGKDMLHKKLDKSTTTYWITRERQPESMKNQF